MKQREPRDLGASKANTRDRDRSWRPATRNSLKATATRSGSSAREKWGRLLKRPEKRLGHRVDVAASGVVRSSVDVALEVAGLASEATEGALRFVPGRHQGGEEERLAEMRELVALARSCRRHVGRHHLAVRCPGASSTQASSSGSAKANDSVVERGHRARARNETPRRCLGRRGRIFRELQVDPLVGTVAGDGNVQRAAELAA